MDSLALLASLVSLSDFAKRLLLHHAPPGAIVELVNELERFKITIEAVGEHVLENTTLKAEVNTAGITIQNITKLLSAHAPDDQSRRSKAIWRVRWAAKDQVKAETLVKSLATHTTRVGILFNAETKLLTNTDHWKLPLRAKCVAQRLDEIERRYKEQLQSIESENTLKRDSMQEEINKLREEKIKLKAGYTTTHFQPSPKMSKVTGLSANVSLRIGADELLALDAPPPYAPTESTVMHESLSSFRDMVNFTFEPIIQNGYTRIEWECTCGDTLYGDYLEKSPGSLQNLVDELGGQVISRPSLDCTSGVPSSSLVSNPPQAHLESQSSGSFLEATSQSYISDRVPNVNEGPIINAGAVGVNVMEQPLVPAKWLELCIRSSPYTYRLGEIDVAGRQTDQTVFYKIKQKYESSRSTVYLFRLFALRIPKGGVFVQFRKDKSATPQNALATASVMVRPSVPKPQEAREYNYIFDPMPMDEPPIDSRTFNHYFHKPHLGDPSATWIKRFPQLQDYSLFYNNEKLAKIWGIEITEDRNWTLIVCANFMALILSATIASLYSSSANDALTCAAIGAWLSAVQARGVYGLFWHWTNQ
ncbi:MAG: hypothetical protein Q9182_005828 [Xanthomendoza sp. 2 TL-2023]